MSMKKKTPKRICITTLPDTPVGALRVAASPHGLVIVDFHDDPGILIDYLERHFPGALLSHLEQFPAGTPLPPEAQIVKTAAEQLQAYLEGERRGFDLPIDWSGMTDFQVQALRATLAIPYGETCTYGEIAQRIGRPQAARAVGRAQATNPMPLVIPCHRVLGSDGSLHGYGGRGGLETKAWLLVLES